LFGTWFGPEPGVTAAPKIDTVKADGFVLAKKVEKDDCVRRAAANPPMDSPPTSPMRSTRVGQPPHRWQKVARRRYQETPSASLLMRPSRAGASLLSPHLPRTVAPPTSPGISSLEPKAPPRVAASASAWYQHHRWAILRVSRWHGGVSTTLLWEKASLAAATALPCPSGQRSEERRGG